MEPIDIQDNQPKPLMSEQHEAVTSYHHKRKMVTVALICLVVIIGLVAWWIIARKHNPKTPAQVLESLAATSQPVTATVDERAETMKTFATAPKKQNPPSSALVAQQLQLLQKLDNK